MTDLGGKTHYFWKHPYCSFCVWLEKSPGGGFKYFLFSSLPGDMIQFDSYVSNGLKPPTRSSFEAKPNSLSNHEGFGKKIKATGLFPSGPRDSNTDRRQGPLEIR